jgi:hypothetical protein
VIYFRLPFLSRQLARPVFAAIPTLMGPGDPQPPPESIVRPVRFVETRVWADVPGTIRLAACFEELPEAQQHLTDLEWEFWVDGFLAQALAEPLELGPDRDILAIGILAAWAFVTDPEDRHLQRLRRVDPEGHAEILRVMKDRVPSLAVQGILRAVARQLRCPPSILLTRPFPEVWFDYLVLLGSQKAARSAGEEQLLEEIGIEN